MEALALGKEEGCHAHDPPLGIEHGGTAGSLGDGGADLKDLACFPGKFSSGGDDSLGEGALQAERTADDCDPRAGLGGVGGCQGEVGEILAFHLKEGEIVGGIGGDDSGHGEKTAVFRLGEDVLCPGDHMVVRDEETVRGNEEAGAGALDLAVLVLEGEEVDGGAGLFGQGAQIGGFRGAEGQGGQNQAKPSEAEDHPSN